eukprot:453463-Rhodomonas_salina.1
MVKGTFQPAITGLDGPTAVVAVGVDAGELVVVASKFSAGLTTFMMGADGAFVQRQTVDCSAQGEPASGTWNGLAVSADGGYVLAVSHNSNAVASFVVRANTAQLECRYFVQDGSSQGSLTVDGIQGAQALTVSEDGQRVYVAGWRDAAVAAFTWDLGGGPCGQGLCYVDRIKSGERVISSLKTFVNESEFDQLPYNTGDFPTRFGGNQQPWSFSVVDSEAWELEGTRFLAVSTGSLVVVSVWDASNSSYRLIQEIADDPAPTALKTFIVPDRENVQWLYLAVGTTLDAAQSGTNPPPSLRVFRWNPTMMRFVLHHDVSLRLRDGSAFEAGTGNRLPSGVTVAKLDFAMVGDGYYLAAACSQAVGYNASVTGPEQARHSYLFRWNPFGTTRLADGDLGLGAGFATFQVLKERGAVDVRLIPAIRTLVVLGLAGTSASARQTSVARFDRELFNVDTGSVEGRFAALGVLSTAAAVSFDAIELPGVGHTLAVGSPASGTIQALQ